MFYTSIKELTEKNDFPGVLKLLVEEERLGNIVLYAGTYSLENARNSFGKYKKATFYVYLVEDKSGFQIYYNRMGMGIKKVDDIYGKSNRYLYNKNHLSNCCFGEKDCRSGEYFRKTRVLKDAVFEIVFELLFFVAAFAVGFVVLCVLPNEFAENIPFEVLVLIGMLVLALIGGAVVFIMHKRKRK